MLEKGDPIVGAVTDAFSCRGVEEGGVGVGVVGGVPVGGGDTSLQGVVKGRVDVPVRVSVVGVDL